MAVGAVALQGPHGSVFLAATRLQALVLFALLRACPDSAEITWLASGDSGREGVAHAAVVVAQLAR